MQQFITNAKRAVESAQQPPVYIMPSAHLRQLQQMIGDINYIGIVELVAPEDRAVLLARVIELLKHQGFTQEQIGRAWNELHEHLDRPVPPTGVHHRDTDQRAVAGHEQPFTDTAATLPSIPAVTQTDQQV